MRALLLCAVLASPMGLAAQEPGDDLPDVVQQIQPGQEVSWAQATVQAFRSAVSERRYGPAVSILLMALLSLFSWVFLRAQELRDAVRPYMGELALAISVLGYVALGLATLPAGADVGAWWGVIGPGIKTGLAAVGGYELVVKRLWQVWAPKLWELVKGLLFKAPENPA